MTPTRTNGAKHFYTEGHDVEGKIYRVKISHRDNEEIERVPTNKRLIWEGGTANLGIKAYKKAAKSLAFKDKHYLISTFKHNVWNNPEMKDRIAKSALKAVEEPKKSKKVIDK